MGPEEHLPANVIPFPSNRRASEQQPLPGIDPGSRHRQREVTFLLAELRDWPAVSERLGHTAARVALSKTIDAALGSLSDRGAGGITLDGDPAQPTISCEFEGEEAAITALRAAIAIRRAIASAQSPSPPEQQFRIGIGIDKGEITQVRADESLTYEAIGAMRMVASRLRDFAGPGQIFITREVYEEAADIAQVQPLGDVRINVHGETKEAFSLTALSET